ncbi:rab11 family-interacting protein 4-like isoform X2 [Dysidea avara]
MDDLVQAMDPDGTGTVSFDSFHKGVASFLLGNTSGDDDEDKDMPDTNNTNGFHDDCNSNASGDEVSSAGDTDSAFSTEAEVYPLASSPSPQPVVNCYHEYVANGEGVSGHEEEVDFNNKSTSGPPFASPTNSKSGKKDSLSKSISFTLGSTSSPRLRHSPRLAKHNNAVVLESLNGSVEESLQQLTAQLISVSSERDQACEEKEVTAARSNQLKEDNKRLMHRVLSFEEKLKDTATSYEDNLQVAEKKHTDAIVKLSNEYELKLDDLKSRLSTTQLEVKSLQSSNYNMTEQLESLDKQKLDLEDQLAEKELQCTQQHKETQRLTEMLRRNNEAWADEKEALNQELSEQLNKVQLLQFECDEAQCKRVSMSTLDIGGEITSLNKEIDRLKEENADLRAQFLQHGKSLITQGPSIASELESASKDKVMAALRDCEDTNQRLKLYIEGLLVTILDRHPELLERK